MINHGEKGVIELRPSGDVSGPVAWVHIANRDQIAGAGEGEQLAGKAPPISANFRYLDRAIYFGQGRTGSLEAPSFFWSDGFNGIDRLVHSSLEWSIN